jgi:hypothetical protein
MKTYEQNPNMRRPIGRPRHPHPLSRLVVSIEAATLDRLRETARSEDRSLSSIVRAALATALLDPARRRTTR